VSDESNVGIELRLIVDVGSWDGVGEITVGVSRTEF
jgi:hypothetical protein